MGIVVGDTEPEIRAALGDGSAFGIKTTYLRQEAPLGLAHAVKIAQGFMKDDSFVILNGISLLWVPISKRAPLPSRHVSTAYESAKHSRP